MKLLFCVLRFTLRLFFVCADIPTSLHTHLGSKVLDIPRARPWKELRSRRWRPWITWYVIIRVKDYWGRRSTSSKLSSQMTSSCCKGGPFSEYLDRREGFERTHFESEFASKIPRDCPLFSARWQIFLFVLAPPSIFSQFVSVVVSNQILL